MNRRIAGLYFGVGIISGFITSQIFVFIINAGLRLCLVDSQLPYEKLGSASKMSEHPANPFIDSFPHRSAKILCIILSSRNDTAKATEVFYSWGRRCTFIYFVTSHNANFGSLPVVSLPHFIPDTRNNLWEKTKIGFSYAYSNYFEKADWFLKADDDTYVIVDNLASMLRTYNTSEPHYFGCKFKKYVAQGYMSGGAGYVLSKGALEKFMDEAVVHEACSYSNLLAEDVAMGRCLESVHVQGRDTRDFLGRGRFFPFVPFLHGFIPGGMKIDVWYWDYVFYRSNEWFDCCAESAISFHYATSLMRLIDFFIYELSPYQRA